MKLNSKQTKVLIISIAIFILMGLYPPWVYTYNNGSVHSEKPAEYELITEPPYPELERVQYGVHLDISRLIVQWLVLLAATIGAILLVSSTHKND